HHSRRTAYQRLQAMEDDVFFALIDAINSFCLFDHGGCGKPIMQHRRKVRAMAAKRLRRPIDEEVHLESLVQAKKPDTAKEFEFTPRDFERVRSLIYKRAGIALADSKQEMVYSRLARR